LTKNNGRLPFSRKTLQGTSPNIPSWKKENHGLKIAKRYGICDRSQENNSPDRKTAWVLFWPSIYKKNIARPIIFPKSSRLKKTIFVNNPTESDISSYLDVPGS